MRTSLRSANRVAPLNCELLEDRVNPVLVYALATAGTTLIQFDSLNPAGATNVGTITGVSATETLVGIDFRPATGQLYALGFNAAGTVGTLYTLSTTPGAVTAAPVAVGGVTPAVGAPNGNPALPATGGFGFDFNPTVDLIRVVNTGGQSFVVNPNTGTVQTNAPILTGPVATADGSGYTNNAPGATVTTLYALDTSPVGTDTLYTQNPGTSALTAVGPLGVDGAIINGFDIPAGVNVTTGGSLATGQSGLAALTVGGTAGLYSINLGTGAATLVGAIGGNPVLRGMAITTGGAVSFQSATLAGTEGGSGLNVVLTRAGGTGPQSVTVTVTGGTATAGTDFPAGPYNVIFANGATTATLNIPFVNDGISEPPETLNLQITNVTNGTIGAQATTTLTVSGQPSVFGQVFGTGSVFPAVTAISTSGAVSTLFPYGNIFSGVRVALGDVNNDGVNDLVTIPSAAAPLVKVFNGVNGAEMASFLAFAGNATFPGTLAVGDVNNDGFDDIVVGTGAFVGAVLVFDGRTFTQQGAFFPFGGLPIGVNVAVGDTDGDGNLEIIASTNSLGAVVGVFNGQTFAQKQIFLPFGAFAAGVTVAAGDVDGDNTDEIIVGTGAFFPLISVFEGTTPTATFFPFPTFPPVGTNVAVNDVNTDGRPDIVAGVTNGLAVANSFDGANLAVLTQLLPFGGFAGGVFVA